MYELIRSDIRHMEETHRVKVIGWITDDGPDGKKARRLLLENMWYLIVLWCWAHQINLVVGDMFRGVAWVRETLHDAVEIITWFNNHGVALDLFWKEQMLSGERSTPLALIRPVLTRWTSHYLAASRLSILEEDMRSCVYRNAARIEQSVGTEAEALSRVRGVLDKVRDGQFWTNLRRYMSRVFSAGLKADPHNMTGRRSILSRWPSQQTSCRARTPG